MDKNNLNSIQSISLPIDTVLNDRYIIKKVLSKGGFSITYIAHDKTLNMSTVIKEFMPKDMLERSQGTTELIVRYDEMQQSFAMGAKNFLDEARIVARFADCEGVVSVMDYFAENNTAYIVMPYIQGTTLSEFIPQSGGLSQQETIEMLKPVIKTLSKVHKAGIIHRDISPDNILITKDRKAILLDFGICMPIESKSKEAVQEKPTSLKHGYAPPEQYCYKGIQGPWTDIYSMAATMYYCIEGKSPLPAVNRMHQSKDIIIRKDINPAIHKGLNLLSKDRFISMDAFLKALDAKGKKTEMKKVLKVVAAAGVVIVAFAAGFIFNGIMQSRNTEIKGVTVEQNEATPKTAGIAETPSPKASETTPESTVYALPYLSSKDEVVFADENLEAAIREEIQKSEGPILFEDIEEVRTLNMVAKGIESLEGIEYFEKLTWLNVNDNFIEDLSPVLYLENLDLLRASGNMIHDVSCLQNSTSISSLELNSNYIEDITPLKNMVNLDSLYLRSNQIKDVSPICNLEKLRWLSISDNDIDDYSSLANLPRIESVDISYDEIGATPVPAQLLSDQDKKEYQLLDLARDDAVPIADANLEAAIRDAINKQTGDILIKDIEGITTLDMLSKGIRDLDGMQYFKNLTRLDLGNNFIEDVAPLAYLEGLNMLRLHGNLVYDIAPLESCTTIAELDLNGNYVEDISSLSALVNLLWLDLCSNKITDAAPIMNLPKLQWLNISGNDLGDYSYLANLPKIEELTIGYGNEIYADAFDDHPTLVSFQP